MRACERCGERNHDDAGYCGTCGVAMPKSGGIASLLDGPEPGSGDQGWNPAGGSAVAASSEHVEPPTFGEETVRGPGAPSVPDGTPTAVPLDATTVQAAVAASAHDTGPTQLRDRGDRTVVAGRVTPARTSRTVGLVVAVVAVSAVVIIGGLFILLASDPGTDETARTALESDGAVASAPTQTAGEVEPESSEPSASETVVVDTVSIETLVPVSDPVGTASPSTTPPTDSTPPATSPATTVTSPVPTRGPGDLGLTQPILDESCDGRYITFVGSAIGDEPYGLVVDELLDRYPGTNYIWTKACPSLRQEFTNGADIYGVVYGPYPTQEEACNARAFGPQDAYVRRISTTDPQDHTVLC